MRSSSHDREYDVVVWGASGYTGQLCVQYLAQQYGTSGSLRWALAGRSISKLNAVKQQIITSCTVDPDEIHILVGDINNQESIRDIASKTKVIMSTAGPFAKIGTPIVDACVACSTNYVDITGEGPWIRGIIDNYHNKAMQKGIKVIPCCGFDCIPTDMGCRMMIDEMVLRGLSPREVRSTVVSIRGNGSGGTIASVMNIFESCSLRQLAESMNPFFLSNREDDGSLDQPPLGVRLAAADKILPDYDSILKTWCTPFVMQAIDTRVVNRSNVLSGWKYGRGFIYSERMAVPFIFAVGAALVTPFAAFLLFFSFTRNLLGYFLPKPGQGPTPEEREKGYFHLKFWGKGVDNAGNMTLVRGGLDAPNGDPGYKQTAVMVCEAAACLALDDENSPKIYGVLTPSTGLGNPLMKRLRQRDIEFYVNDEN